MGEPATLTSWPVPTTSGRAASPTGSRLPPSTDSPTRTGTTTTCPTMLPSSSCPHPSPSTTTSSPAACPSPATPCPPARWSPLLVGASPPPPPAASLPNFARSTTCPSSPTGSAMTSTVLSATVWSVLTQPVDVDPATVTLVALSS